MQRLITWIARIYLGYLFLSLVVLLPALNVAAPLLADKYLGRSLKTELILFNPFSLALEVRKASLSEADDREAEFAALGRFEANLSLASLWRQGWVLDSLLLEDFFAHLRRVDAERFNFSDLMAAGDDSPSAEPAAIPGITIGKLSLHARQLLIADETRQPVYTNHWDHLSINVQDLSTVREEGQPYRLAVTVEGGGRLEWEGDVSIPGGFSEGRLSLSDGQLRTPWRFLQPWLGFEVRGGTLSVAGNYRVNWLDELSWALEGGSVTVNTLDIQPADPGALPDTHVRLTRFALQDIAVDGPAQRVEIGSAKLNGLDIGGFSEGSRVSLAELFAVNLPQTDDPQAANQTDTEAPPWQVSLASFSNEAGRVAWRSEYTRPERLQVHDLALAVTDIAWPAERASGVQLQLGINDTATLQVTGDLNLESGDGALDFELAQLPLDWFSPNLPSALRADISGGATQARGTMSLAQFVPGQVQLDGNIGKFEVIIHEETASITGWESVRWESLRIDLNQQLVVADSLFIDRYSGRLHIREDGTINAQRLLQEEAAKAAAEQPPGEESAPWEVRLPAIFISDSVLDFMDESLPLHFRTVIGDLNGDITGLGTSADSELTVNLKGTVDGYAPVLLAGTARPFGEQPALDMGLSFEGIDLVRLTPYSGTYAGYAIERGLLNLDLKYALEKNRLQGDNKVVIDQLKLGEQIDSDKAIDLPLELALALLTDSNGVIDLAVPVSGDLDNPEFSLASVIMGAFVNLITKAITAPFTLLANLVGSEEDLERVTYAAGSAELDDAGKAKLATLAQALNQRPELKLVIMGQLHPTTDREKLQRAALRQSLLAEGMAESDITSRSEAWVAAIDRQYRELGSPAGEDVTLQARAEAVLASYPISEAELAGLAEERAANAKRYLVIELQISADRSVIETGDATDEANTFSGIKMSVDT